MIFFSIGLPSRLAELCDALTALLAQRALGSVEAGSFNSLEDVGRAAIRSEAAHLVAASRQPVVRLQSEIVDAGRPFVLVLGDPRAALEDLVQRPGYDLVRATREVASSCAALLSLAKAPGSLVLTAADHDDPVRLASAIAGHFGFELARHDLAAIAASVAHDIDPAAAQQAQSTGRLSEHQQAIVSGALQPYVTYFAGGELASIVWEPDLFFSHEDRRPAIGPVDITGLARILVFGPYINLPPGAWSATVVIGFSAEAAGIGFVIEIYAGTQLGTTRMQPSGEQVIEATLQFTIESSVDYPVEIRVISERAAFDGRLALGYVSLSPRAGVRSETEQQLIESLRQ